MNGQKRDSKEHRRDLRLPNRQRDRTEFSKGAMRLNSYLLKSTVVAALGGLLFGFDTAVIAGTTHALSETFRLSPAALGMTVPAALWGTILGSMLAGIPGDKFGRRDSLRVMAVLYLVSSLGCAFAGNWTALVLFRFIGGLGIGGSSVLGPMYIAEVAPARWRGRLVGLFQFNIVFGIRKTRSISTRVLNNEITMSSSCCSRRR